MWRLDLPFLKRANSPFELPEDAACSVQAFSLSCPLWWLNMVLEAESQVSVCFTAQVGAISKPQIHHHKMGTIGYFTSTGIPQIIALHFMKLCGYCVFFLQIQVCGNPALASLWAFFQQFTQPVSLCHILVNLKYFKHLHCHCSC